MVVRVLHAAQDWTRFFPVSQNPQANFLSDRIHRIMQNLILFIRLILRRNSKAGVTQAEAGKCSG
jgi:hypothetical protein